MEGGLALAALGASSILALIILDKENKGRYYEPQEDVEERHVSSALPPTGQVVPFKLIKENPVIPILLDGDEHLTCWIVDTGYGFTAVDTGLKKRFQKEGIPLQSIGKLSVQTL